MLLRFKVANHRSINAPVELSMVAVDADRPAARSFANLNESVLTTAGIYGPNASGKSNILDAFGWLSGAVKQSLYSWDEEIPRDPFRYKDARARETSFEVEMIVDNVRYAYFVELTDSQVEYEALYSYPERRPRKLFEREGLELTLRRGLGSLSGTRDLLSPTTLALSAALRPDTEIRSFARHLTDVQSLGKHRHVPRLIGSRFHSTDRLLLDSLPSHQESGHEDAPSALDLLRFADLGIDNFEVVEIPYEDRVSRQIRLIHQVGGESQSFGMNDESEGTLTWYRLIGPVIEALRRGETILLDEIDASLHPRLSAKLLELFQDPETNPRGAQLIFTTHDTSLLNHLNRDEVWLTEKREDGSTDLVALAEFGGDKVRRSLNLEKAYLQGRFGAVPELDQMLLRRALGLEKSDSTRAS